MKKLSSIGENINALKLKFDNNLLDEIRDSYLQDLSLILTHKANHHILDGNKEYTMHVGSQGGNYFLVSYGTNPLLWFSSNNDRTYQIYKRFFEALDIECEIRNLVDYNEKIVLYCGFLVIGNHAPNEVWHVDYQPGANAYTLICPLFELDQNHGNLLYQVSPHQVETYTYTLGEALVFGDHFMHATEKYNRTDRLRILVSLQFGTDKMEHWDVLRRTIESQSNYLVQPCGHIRGSCQC